MFSSLSNLAPIEEADEDDDAISEEIRQLIEECNAEPHIDNIENIPPNNTGKKGKSHNAILSSSQYIDAMKRHNKKKEDAEKKKQANREKRLLNAQKNLEQAKQRVERMQKNIYTNK